MTQEIRQAHVKGMHRIQYRLSHCLRLTIWGHHDEAAAYICVLLRAIHQTQIDGGSWNDAALLLPDEDPITPAEWAANHRDIEAVASYRQSLWQLRRQRGQNWQGNQWQEQARDEDGRQKGD